MTAWGAFHNTKAKITASSKSADAINDFHLENLKCLKSSKIFGSIQHVSSNKVINYFKKVVTRDFLLNASKPHKETGIKVAQVFKDNYPIIDPIKDLDYAKAYSVFQYLEGCFIINEIVSKKIEEQGDINVVFALPNDESKYYQDELNSFASDIQVLLQENFGSALLDKKVNVNFLCFNYSNETWHRPYNAGKEILKKVSPKDVF